MNWDFYGISLVERFIPGTKHKSKGIALTEIWLSLPTQPPLLTIGERKYKKNYIFLLLEYIPII